MIDLTLHNSVIRSRSLHPTVAPETLASPSFFRAILTLVKTRTDNLIAVLRRRRTTGWTIFWNIIYATGWHFCLNWCGRGRRTRCIYHTVGSIFCVWRCHKAIQASACVPPGVLFQSSFDTHGNGVVRATTSLITFNIKQQCTFITLFACRSLATRLKPTYRT